MSGYRKEWDQPSMSQDLRKILLGRKEKGKCLGLWVREEVNVSVMLKKCSGLRLWLGMDLSLWTGGRMAVSRLRDGVWTGVWPRSYLAVCSKGSPPRQTPVCS